MYSSTTFCNLNLWLAWTKELSSLEIKLTLCQYIWLQQHQWFSLLTLFPPPSLSIKPPLLPKYTPQTSEGTQPCMWLYYKITHVTAHKIPLCTWSCQSLFHLNQGFLTFFAHVPLESPVAKLSSINDLGSFIWITMYEQRQCVTQLRT